MNIYRQGDILFIEEETAPTENTTAIPAENGLYIFAYGEVTGHHHSTLALPEIKYFGQADDKWLDTRSAQADVDVNHQEHNTITLPKGKVFRVKRQRIYTPEAIRNVAD